MKVIIGHFLIKNSRGYILDKDLHKRIDEILFYKWDPIRVSNSNWPRDEYTLYVNEVMELAVNSTTHQPLAEHLERLAAEVIGCPVSKGRTYKVAELIFSIVHGEEYNPDHYVVVVD